MGTEAEWKKAEALFCFQYTDGGRNGGSEEYVLPFCPKELRFSIGQKKKKKRDMQEKNGAVSKKSTEQQLFSGVTMNMHLIVDKSREEESVKPEVDRLMTELREGVFGRQIVFCWGAITFQGVLEHISANYVMFAADGTALRAEIDLVIVSQEKEELKRFFQNDYQTLFRPGSSGKAKGGKAVLAVGGDGNSREYQVQYNPGSLQCSGERAAALVGENAGSTVDNIPQHTAPVEDALSLELNFTGKETRKQVNGLLGLKVIDDQKQIGFHWGEQYFEGRVSSVQGEYTSFLDNGEPDSGKVSMTISGKGYEI